MINLSFLKLKGNIVDNYEQTKKGWRSKQVLWTDVYKLMTNSKIQYSPFTWRNGYKTMDNWSNNNQDIIVLDIDNGLSISDFQKRYSSFDYILGTTKSHQKDKHNLVCDRYRVIFKAININHNIDIYARSVELFCPDTDLQTLTKTSSFLGYDDAIVIYNQGKAVDMFLYSEVASKQLETEKAEKILIDKDMLPTYRGLSMQAIKEQLTFEIVVDILTSIGYEVRKNKFKLREERTSSATISYKSLVITDYGSGWYGDVISVLKEYHSMSMVEAMKYVCGYIG